MRPTLQGPWQGSLWFLVGAGLESPGMGVRFGFRLVEGHVVLA